MNLSLIDIYAIYGSYYGAESIEYTGDYYTLQ